MPFHVFSQLEEEAGKLYDLIMEEDQITLGATADTIIPIQRWIEKWSLVLWKRLSENSSSGTQPSRRRSSFCHK